MSLWEYIKYLRVKKQLKFTSNKAVIVTQFTEEKLFSRLGFYKMSCCCLIGPNKSVRQCCVTSNYSEKLKPAAKLANRLKII